MANNAKQETLDPFVLATMVKKIVKLSLSCPRRLLHRLFGLDRNSRFGELWFTDS
jgi:hypothetical protein